MQYMNFHHGTIHFHLLSSSCRCNPMSARKSIWITGERKYSVFTSWFNLKIPHGKIQDTVPLALAIVGSSIPPRHASIQACHCRFEHHSGRPSASCPLCNRAKENSLAHPRLMIHRLFLGRRGPCVGIFACCSLNHQSLLLWGR